MSDKDKTNTDDEDVLLQTAKSNSEEGESVDGISLDSDLLKNIPVTISVEVGRTSLQIKELMRLTQGSVVELDRLAGEPLDLLVNDTLVAQGEIVLVNDRYGMRLTQRVPKSERMKLL
jgi:flagellar motor switch protein FliN/FliY